MFTRKKFWVQLQKWRVLVFDTINAGDSPQSFKMFHMVKTRSSDGTLPKQKQKERSVSKARQFFKKRKVYQQEQINPSTFFWKSEMILDQQSQQQFEAEKYLIDIPQKDHAENQQHKNSFSIEIYDIMEHKSTQDQTVSSASTQNKMDVNQSRQHNNQSQFGFTLDSKNMSKNQYRDYCLEISSCDSVDIQIERKAQESLSHQLRRDLVNHNKNQNDRNPQVLPQISIRQPQDQQIIQQQMQIQQPFMNLVQFGPQNIDQLSTNYSLNAHSEQRMAQFVPEVRHIFMQNDQNIFENLSQISTKPCMSHDHFELEFTDQDYSKMFWDVQNKYRGLARTTEEKEARLIYFLTIMRKYVMKRSLETLTLNQRTQFWSILQENSFQIQHITTIAQMIHFIKNYEDSAFEEKKNFKYEYEMIKCRVESLRVFFELKSEAWKLDEANKLLKEQ